MMYRYNNKLLELYKSKLTTNNIKHKRHKLYQTKQGEILLDKNNKPLLLESTLQQQCKSYFLTEFGDWKINKKAPMFVHIVNEMQASSMGQRLAAGIKFKKEGKVKGFPDIMILYKNKQLLIELKAINGHIDDDQKIVAEYLKYHNFDYALLKTNDVNDFLDIVRNWFKCNNKNE